MLPYAASVMRNRIMRMSPHQASRIMQRRAVLARLRQHAAIRSFRLAEPLHADVATPGEPHQAAPYRAAALRPGSARRLNNTSGS